MRLACIYTTFNALEWLEPNIEHHKGLFDEIIIVDQNKSWYGNERKTKFPKLDCEHHYIEYIPTRADSKQQEKIKHIQGINKAKELGCTHYVIMATDHFYDRKQLEWAKKFCENTDVLSTATRMYTYIKELDLRLEPMEGYYCPFINKITSTSSIGNKYPVYVDPALQIYPHNTFKEFHPSEVIMHHYSWVRHDVESKVLNAAARRNWKGKERKLIEEWRNLKEGSTFSYYPKHVLVREKGVFQN